jgi:hypothetical protein
MSEQEFKQLVTLLDGVLSCKTQAHRKLAVSMIINLLREKVTK